jgi:uncharacterized LabA/DUF88 family protein
MEKAVILIDGGYLYRILRDNFKSYDISFEKLSDVICNTLNLERLRTYYYTAMPYKRKNNLEDEKRYEKRQKFITSLKRIPRFEVKFGKLQLIGGQFRQKMVDVLMSIDIVKKSYSRNIKHIILIAGDADFVPAIKTAKDLDVIVHLFYYPSSVHNELLDEIDEPHIIDENLINNLKNKDSEILK